MNLKQVSLCHLAHQKQNYKENTGKLNETDESLHHNGRQTFTMKKGSVPK